MDQITTCRYVLQFPSALQHLLVFTPANVLCWFTPMALVSDCLQMQAAVFSLINPLYTAAQHQTADQQR